MEVHQVVVGLLWAIYRKYSCGFFCPPERLALLSLARRTQSHSLDCILLSSAICVYCQSLMPPCLAQKFRFRSQSFTSICLAQNFHLGSSILLMARQERSSLSEISCQHELWLSRACIPDLADITKDSHVTSAVCFSTTCTNMSLTGSLY